MGRRFEKLCVFGCFDDSELYSRNRVLIDALALHCSSVIEVRPLSDLPPASNQARISSIGKVFKTAAVMVRNFFSLARQRKQLRDADIFFVPYPAYMDLLFLRILTFGWGARPIVVDAFLCLHDTLVLDRKMIRPKGVLALMVSWIERLTLRSADLVLIDTNNQRAVLVGQYDLEEANIATIPVGIDEAVWNPSPELALKDQFLVLFWGTFIPLHGVQTIVSAAHRLQNSHPQIRFTLIGDGQTAGQVYDEMESLGVTNISWQRSLLPATELRRHVDTSHCVLGIFGGSDKAGNVIPYKVHQAMACNKIVISRNGPAFDEIPAAASEPGLVLLPPANPDALAAGILNVYESYQERSSKLKTGQLYEKCLGSRVIHARVAEALDSL